MATKKRVTSSKVIKDFMDNNNLTSAFVIEAVGRYAKQCLENEEATINSLKGTFIDGKSWVYVAKLAQETIDNYNKQP